MANATLLYFVFPIKITTKMGKDIITYVFIIFTIIFMLGVIVSINVRKNKEINIVMIFVIIKNNLVSSILKNLFF
jgi:hypothetical protein